jgi:hypothetical protein
MKFIRKSWKNFVGFQDLLTVAEESWIFMVERKMVLEGVNQSVLVF